MKANTDLVKWLQSMANDYQPMSIDEFMNEVWPIETMKLLSDDVLQAVNENEFDPKDIDTLINVLKIGKLQLSRPQHDKSKTKVSNKIKAEYLQNLIETLELQKSLNTNISVKPEGKKVAQKYFALLHLILISLGKEPQIGDKTKAEIIDIGKRKYQTGQVFYREIRNIDLLNMTAFVRSLAKKIVVNGRK